MKGSCSRDSQSSHKGRNKNNTWRNQRFRLYRRTLSSPCINYIGERVNVCKEQSSLRCQRTYSSLSKKENVSIDASERMTHKVRLSSLRHSARFSSHKGMSLTIETMIVIILAVLVLAVLVFFFMNFFGGGESEVARQVKQKDNCLAYARTNPKCSNTLNSRVSSTVKTALEDVCKKMSFPECENPPLNIPCVRQCCKEYCSGGANRCREDLGGSSCGTSCSAGEIPEGNADCQQPPLDSTYKCCK